MAVPMNKNDAHRLLGSEGERGRKLLSILGKQLEFVNALNSKIGQELLKDLINITEDRLQKIVNEDYGDDNETVIKAEYRVAKFLLTKYAEKVSAYEKNLETALKGGRQ